MGSALSSAATSPEPIGSFVATSFSFVCESIVMSSSSGYFLHRCSVKSALTIFCCQWYSNSLDMMRAILYTTSSSLLYVIAFDHTSRTSAAYF